MRSERSIPAQAKISDAVSVKHYHDNAWSGIFVDFLFYGLMFSEERGFGDAQTSALFSALTLCGHQFLVARRGEGVSALVWSKFPAESRSSGRLASQVLKRVFEFTFRPDLEPGDVDPAEPRVI